MWLPISVGSHATFGSDPKPRLDCLALCSPSTLLAGFPPRIIIFFSLLLTILYLTGAISVPHSSSSLSSSHGSSHHGVTHSHLLTPHDYLNASLSEPAPFAFCPLYGPGDEVANRRGQVNLLKTRLHTGTGARVQKVVRKALSGAPLTISVLGASGKSDLPMWLVSSGLGWGSRRSLQAS